MKRIRTEADVIENILDGDFIVSIKNCSGTDLYASSLKKKNKNKRGFLTSSRTKVFIKNKEWRQLGLIQDFKLECNANKVPVSITITFPDHSNFSTLVKAVIKENIEDLIRLGINIKKQKLISKKTSTVLKMI
jgi:hypothetical protein